MDKTKEEKQAAADKLKADKKATAAKLAADKKAAAAKLKADKKAAAAKLAADKKAAAAKLTAERVGKDLKIKLPSGVTFEGLCTCVRKINGGAQVFLKIKGAVARWFNAEDIVE